MDRSKYFCPRTFFVAHCDMQDGVKS